MYCYACKFHNQLTLQHTDIPDLFINVYGTRSYFLSIFQRLVCFKSILSQGVKSLYSACLLLSMYVLFLYVCTLSVSRTFSSLHLSRPNCDNLVFICLQNISGCSLGYRMWCRTILHQILCLYFPFPVLFPAQAILIRFKRERFCLSISPFADGNKGVVL